MANISFSTDCEPYFTQWLWWWFVRLGAALLLLWPAALNGYPLVFSDTGTYLSQMIERHLGWDRPIFYSLAILPLHATLTTWPVVAVQALVSVLVLSLALRCFVGNARALLVVVVLLSVLTPLPWVTAELMPDFGTALLAIVLAILVITPERLHRYETAVIVLLAAGLIATHQSNVPLAVLLLAVLLPLRRHLGAGTRLTWQGIGLVCAGPALAVLALVGVNLVGHGRASLSPYGNIFLLARSIDDGPARNALRRHCPQSGWRLCIMAADAKPMTADEFLWRQDSPLYRAGGPKLVSAEANAILAAAVREEPWATLRAAARNWGLQLGMAATGDGLIPWPFTVGPVIHRDFPPAEARRYDAARQTRGQLVVPAWLSDLHIAALALGMAATLAALAAAVWRRHRVAGLCAAVLICLLGNAAITGALSGPHDRYQSRVAWLAPFTPMVAALALRRHERRDALSPSHGQVQADGAAPIVWSG